MQSMKEKLISESPGSDYKLIENAFRQSVADIIKSWRGSQPTPLKCPLTGELRDRVSAWWAYHVPPKTFPHLMESFLTENNLKLSDVYVQGQRAGDAISDPAIAARWRAYYTKNKVLILASSKGVSKLAGRYGRK